MSSDTHLKPEDSDPETIEESEEEHKVVSIEETVRSSGYSKKLDYSEGYRIDDLMGYVIDGRYELDELIGKGAMGAVFRARQLRLRRTVAIKVPRPEIFENRSYRGRFEREALTMAKMIHPNIVQIIDVLYSEDPNSPSFIAMEFVEGENFADFLMEQASSLTVSAVLKILEQIAGGLDAAHSHGIVHRDIKPANIMITMPQHIPKIMDFGIAKVEIENAFQTMSSEALGTPAYMSPEQVAGEEITHKSDLYSYGIMVYAILVGIFPHDVDRRDVRRVMQAHISKDVVPPSKNNAMLPRKVDKIFAAILSKDPEKRPRNAMQFIKSLQEAMRGVNDRSLAFICNPENTTTNHDAIANDTGFKVPGQVTHFPVIMTTLVSLGVIALIIIITLLITDPPVTEPAQPIDVVAANSNEPPQQATEPGNNSTPNGSIDSEVVTPETSDTDDQSVAVITQTPEPIPEPTISPTPEPATPENREPVVETPTPQIIPPSTPIAGPRIITGRDGDDTPIIPGIDIIPVESDRGNKLSDSEIPASRQQIESYIDQRLEKPVGQGIEDKAQNHFLNLTGGASKYLQLKVRELSESNNDIELKFIVDNNRSRYWENRAELICTVEIHVNASTNNRRKVDLTYDSGTLTLIKQGNNWLAKSFR